MNKKIKIYKVGSDIAAIAVVLSVVYQAIILFGSSDKAGGGPIAISACAIALWCLMYSRYIREKKK